MDRSVHSMRCSGPTIPIRIGSLPGILALLKNITRVFSIFLALSGMIGCGNDQSPGSLLVSLPDWSAQPEISRACGTLSLSQGIRAFWPTGTSTWDWTTCDNSQQGLALLEIYPSETGGQGRLDYRWAFQPGLPNHPSLFPICLTPQDSTEWLPFRTLPDLWPVPSPALPLPWIPAASGLYDNLIDFLKEMTSSHFESIICHWPELPIPVRLGTAQNDGLDLSACLAEAVQIWNRTDGMTWFRVDEEAAWGVRLVHFPGAILRPPLEARITRLDESGRPLRIHIIVGDNYDGSQDRPYAVRGLVHELGHALFLWGHSLDRNHILWASGPPLVNAPSQDERKAAQLWHGLPEGLDLNNYLSEP